jgi:hypothetical protein
MQPTVPKSPLGDLGAVAEIDHITICSNLQKNTLCVL